MARIKRVLKRLVDKLPNSLSNVLKILYTEIRYPSMREKRVSYGNNNPQMTFYIIRPREDGVQGLMSLLLDVVRHIEYACNKGFIPVVDFKNYETQYSKGNKYNTWEYYFDQPCGYSLDDAYNSKNVILSGFKAISGENPKWDFIISDTYISSVRSFMHKYIRVSDSVMNLLNSELETIDQDKTIGIYMRGTDYTKLKPAGHYVQPEVNAVIDKAEKIMTENNLNNVFLVTEDYKIYQQIKDHFGDLLYIARFDSFIKNYESEEFLSKSEEALMQLGESAYERGMHYLCKLLILSKLKFFVGGVTAGSWAVTAFSDSFTDSYLFDLGRY